MKISAFRINAQMGLLTAMAIAFALAIDFLLLPALLLVGYKQKKGKVDHEETILQRAA